MNLIKEKKVHQILHLVLRINNTPDYSANIEFSGHVFNLSVRVYLKGNFEDEVYQNYLYTDRDLYKIEEINKMIADLTDILIKVPEYQTE
jgi:hypothetical protein